MKKTPTMEELGRQYNDCCEAMLAGGLQWIKDHPQSDPKFSQLKGCFGVVLADNKDARALEKAILKPAKGEATGAMFHAVVAQVLGALKKAKEGE